MKKDMGKVLEKTNDLKGQDGVPPFRRMAFPLSLSVGIRKAQSDQAVWKQTSQCLSRTSPRSVDVFLALTNVVHQMLQVKPLFSRG